MAMSFILVRCVMQFYFSPGSILMSLAVAKAGGVPTPKSAAIVCLKSFYCTTFSTFMFGGPPQIGTQT